MSNPRLKRRSSLGPRHAHMMAAANSSSEGSTPPMGSPPPPEMDATPTNDDDAERRRRHERGVANKRRSIAVNNVGTPNAGQGPQQVGTPTVVGGVVTTLSAAQLAEHYTNCMKLSAENKISMKNAFQLRLIDTMTEMIKKKAKDLDNFQSASCALDASTKIYAYRVDSVHHETLKLASGVGSSKNATKSQQDNGQEDDGGAGADGAQQTKKKRKRRANTIEKNLSNINMPKFDLEFDTDPLFKKISAQFDSGGGGGQFLHTLPMLDDSCQLLLDSAAVMGTKLDAIPEPEPAIEMAADDENGIVMPKLEPNSKICPDFADFTFRGWSLTEDDELNQSLSALNDRANEEEAIQLGLENDEHVFDPNDLPDDLDGGGGNDFGGADFDDLAGGGDDDDLEANQMNRNKPRMTMALMDINHLREHLAPVPSEYSYFDTGRLGAWAGPQHWKFKSAPLRAPQRPGEDKTGSKSKKKKESEELAFDNLLDEDMLTLSISRKSLTVPKKAIKLQNKTIESWADEKNLLPEDLHYSGKDFIILEGLPKMHLAPTKKSATVDEDEVGDYDFDNLNDSQNYCPDVGGAGDLADDDATGGDFTNVFSQTQAGLTTGEDGTTTGIDGEDGNLVAAPNRIEKIQIGYAKLAKKVDMRRLKRVQWSILQDKALINKTVANKENESGNEESTVLAAEDTTTMQSDVKFSDVYSSLKVSRELPSKMKEGLSVPLAFVALLHLCNEETLKLENSIQLDDLTISRG